MISRGKCHWSLHSVHQISCSIIKIIVKLTDDANTTSTSDTYEFIIKFNILLAKNNTKFSNLSQRNMKFDLKQSEIYTRVP